MKRPVRSARFRSSFGPSAGYTLVEILVAAALALVMVGAVVQIFGSVSQNLNESRATLEMSDRVRAARTRLEMDLAGATATMIPPERPEAASGYLEYTEGPVGPLFPVNPAATVVDSNTIAINNDDPAAITPDTTVGDFDDVLMFTIRSSGQPFVGLYWDPDNGQSTIESDVAEVAWFVRGRTLYRRMLLVVPGLAPDDLGKDPSKSFYACNDISVRLENSVLVANSLADLSRHQARFAHPLVDGYPSHPHFTATWPISSPTIPSSRWATVAPDRKLGPGLPTLLECCASSGAGGSKAWPTDGLPTINALTERTQMDFWAQNPYPWPEVDPVTGTLVEYRDWDPSQPPPASLRIAEDAILSNVIGFDVKVWDPDAEVRRDAADTTALGPSDPGYDKLSTPVSHGAFVDLNYNALGGFGDSAFSGAGNPRSGMIRVYDTWSSHYEDDGLDQDNAMGSDQGVNGFDDNGDGVVDDPAEREVPPPYDVPLRAIQVKIRTFEPDSREIREVTVVQDFLP